MNYFISGGAGFIGSHICKFLLNLENSINKVKVFDNLSSGTKEHVSNFYNNPNFKLVEGDIKDFELLSESMKNFDVVIHLAANPDISKAVTSPSIDFWEGTYLTHNILEAMRINNIKYILYTSGSGVYGENSSEFFKESYGPMFPISTYGASKLGCEALISSYSHMFDIKGRTFRFANVVGPKQTHGVGYDFVRKLINDGDKLTILGDGTQKKSYIHVDDVINAIFTIFQKDLLLNNSTFYDVFNVATDNYITVNEIANIAIEELNLNKNKVKKIFTGGDRGWKGDVPKVNFNTDKIKSFDYSTKMDSVAAIRDSISAE